MRLALIGNGTVSSDFSDVIDGCDLVIRCNEAKTLGQNTGFKTDILCINNTGAPARRLINLRSVQRHPRFISLQEVWLPRDSNVHLQWLDKVNIKFSRSEFIDVGNEIISANNLSHLCIHRFSMDFNKRAFSFLAHTSLKPFICPSTGFLAFLHIIEDEKFEKFEKLFFGLTFNMWSGHPAESGRLFFLQQVFAGCDMKIFV